MRFGPLPVVLVLYVAADFANPLMPGAVSFTDGLIQAVRAERARPADLPGDLPGLPVLAGAEPVSPDVSDPRPTPVRAAARWLAPVRRAAARRRAPPPPVEDH
jgi:hypothetical protein